MLFESLSSFDAEHASLQKSQMHASWFRKIEGKQRGEREWKRAGPLTSTNLSPSQPFFFFSLSPPYLPKPSNYNNEWLRARQSEAVRDWEDTWSRGGGGEGDSSPLFICYECHSSPDPVLIGQCRLTAGTRCQDPHRSVLSHWADVLACGLKWKCHSKAALIESTFLWKPGKQWSYIQNHCHPRSLSLNQKWRVIPQAERRIYI